MVKTNRKDANGERRKDKTALNWQKRDVRKRLLRSFGSTHKNQFGLSLVDETKLRPGKYARRQTILQSETRTDLKPWHAALRWKEQQQQRRRNKRTPQEPQRRGGSRGAKTEKKMSWHVKKKRCKAKMAKEATTANKDIRSTRIISTMRPIAIRYI